MPVRVLFRRVRAGPGQQPDRGDVACPARVVQRRVSQIVPHVGIGPEPKQGCDEFRVRGRVTRDVQRGLVSGYRPVVRGHRVRDVPDPQVNVRAAVAEDPQRRAEMSVPNRLVQRGDAEGITPIGGRAVP